MTSNTTQQLWRTDFDRQYTKDMLRDLVRQATSLIRRYERITPWRNKETPQDRIHSAVMKLLAGSRTWDPVRVDLRKFLLGVIASDISTELAHSEKFQQVSLDRRKHRIAELDMSDLLGEIRSTSHEAVEGAWSLAMAELRRLAGAEKRVHTLLDAYDQGAFEKRDVLRLTRWPSRTYRAAYNRVLQLADEIEDELRGAIVEKLAN